MKMGIGLFWGIILIVIGFSIVFKVIFDINVFRIIIAIFFILIGIKILVGKSAFHYSSKDNDVVFNDKYYTEFPTSDKEYNTIFGKSVYDFSDAPIYVNNPIKLEFNTIFGDSEIRLPEGLPVKIKADAVFGAAKMPNNNTAVFGSTNYVTEHDSSSKFVNIEVNTIFGNTEVKQ